MARKKLGFYRDRSGRVVIQVYDPATKRPKKLPRADVEHLDAATDEEVVRWREWYLAERAHARRAQARLLGPADEAQFLFDAFQERWGKLRRTGETTLEDDLGRWHLHIVPYFVELHGAKDVRLWDLHMQGYPLWLLSRGELQTNQQKKVIRLLLRFGEYLRETKKIPAPWTCTLPASNEAMETPLEVELTPDQVLSWCAGRSWRAQLFALLGYFASLRPEETFVLQKSDFLTGAEARAAAKTHARFQEYELGSGLSVSIERAFKKTGKVGDPKTRNSRAVVNIWHSGAAKRIAELLRSRPDGWLFPSKDRPDFPLARDTQFAWWAKHGKPSLGATLHDLRRASGLYLGRTVDVPMSLLQDHIRHADLKSVLGYMRRPEAKKVVAPAQDFDDVG